MSLMSNEYRDRLSHWLRTLQQDFYQSLQSLHFVGFQTMDHLTPMQASQQNFQPIAEGYTWGKTWEYLWLRTTITLDDAAQNEAIVMSLDLSGEATLFVNGEAFGTRRAEWVTTPHHYMVDNTLTLCGKPGETFDLLFEVYAGHYFPDAGSCATGPVLPGAYQDPKQEGRRATVGKSTYGIWNEDAYQLWLDVTTLDMLLAQLPEDSLRAASIADGLELFTRTVDFEQERAERIATYRLARKQLHPLMAAHNGSTAPRMLAVGNAHLDLAWLWPQQETHRKTARTFAAQLRLLERYPEYRFVQSQPAAYEMCRDHYPELYQRIIKAIQTGRWIAEGAMYVEPDTNMASGEALIRQLVYGKRFFLDEFGVDSRMLWLPDTFGYTAALPQLLKGCHVDYLVTQKIFWSYNEGDRFPYHYFTWKGMDGSTVTSFLPTNYTYRTDPKELCGVWRERVQKRNLDHFLIPFGYGDGGGGPCRDHVEYLLREQDLEGMPKAEMASPLSLFTELEAEGGPVHTWDGELYFTAHRGTYTSQAAIKWNNRRSEFALREMELWGTLAQDISYPQADAERLWKILLLNQFHDILPGSSIARVYTEANAAHAALQQEADTWAASARKTLIQKSTGVTYFNSLSFAREAVVPLPASFSSGACTPDGTPVPVADGKALITLPSLGAISLLPTENRASKIPYAYASLTPEGAILENAQVRVIFNQNGEVISYRHTSGREYAAGAMNRFLLFKDVPRLFDAWDIDSNYRQQLVEVNSEATLTVTCAKGLTASLRLTRSIGHSSLVQEIALDGNSPCVLFHTAVEWNELHRLLKVAFPVDVHAENAIHEMQFGYVERPTHRSRAYDQDRFEVCNHRYTALADHSHGCAVFNDGKYGVGVEGNSIELTLLRAAASPEMRTDNGMQQFTYAFDAWEGSFADSPVVRQGYQLNVPITQCEGQLDTFSAFTVDAPNVFIDTVKPADDESGDLVLRLYEGLKADTFFRVQTPLPIAQAWLCDMLENTESEMQIQNGQISLHVRPFEVLTLRLSKSV